MPFEDIEFASADQFAEGGDAKLYYVSLKNQPGQKYAAKIIDLKGAHPNQWEETEALFMREVATMTNHMHLANVILLHHAFVDRNSQRFGMVMELAMHGTLRTVLDSERPSGPAMDSRMALLRGACCGCVPFASRHASCEQCVPNRPRQDERSRVERTGPSGSQGEQQKNPLPVSRESLAEV